MLGARRRLWDLTMRFRADIATLENKRDKVLSVCQLGPEGEIEYEVIIQRGPKEYDILDDAPGPKISFDPLGLYLAPGPAAIRFSGNIMSIVVTGQEDIEVDLSPLSDNERALLMKVAGNLFK
jgi:hypothetical protein